MLKVCLRWPLEVCVNLEDGLTVPETPRLRLGTKSHIARYKRDSPLPITAQVALRFSVSKQLAEAKRQWELQGGAAGASSSKRITR